MYTTHYRRRVNTPYQHHPHHPHHQATVKLDSGTILVHIGLVQIQNVYGYRFFHKWNNRRVADGKVYAKIN